MHTYLQNALHFLVRPLVKPLLYVGVTWAAWYGYTSIPSVMWLGKNLYFEARDEGFFGWLAVANVTFNRIDDSRWPNTVKQIVTGGTERGIKCDFSWYCDGKPDVPSTAINKVKLQGHYALAGVFITLNHFGLLPDITHGAHSYQRKELQDDTGWFGTLQATVIINNHKFYRDRSSARL